MSEPVPSYCRLCEGLCGVHAHVQDNRIVSLDGDPENPKSAGHLCGIGEASVRVQGPDRIQNPMRREGHQLVEVDWDTAIKEIGAALGKTRRAHGPRSVGMYLGAPMAHDHLGALRAGAMALGLGTPNLFSALPMHGGSKLRATELVVGAAIPLIADVGRSHYTILLGSDQLNQRWGPFQAGTIHTQALRYFKNRRKGTKLIAVDSQRTELAGEADQFVQIRPGTEVFYLLGLAHATLNNKWIDAQYVDDYCTGVERAREWLAPWDPARCAEICGIDPGDLLGVGLKFGRSAMSTIVASPSVTQSEHGTVAMWALLTTMALTANLLRPGGLYESGGILDLHPLISSFPCHSAPRTRVSESPLLLLQAPGTALAQEILEPGDAQLRALITVCGDPVQELPGRARVGRALDKLDLLVAIDSHRSQATQRADWVLPSTVPWERRDLHLLDNAALPSRFLQATPALIENASGARDTSEVLRALWGATDAPLRGGAWGRHLRVLGRMLASADLEQWINQALEFSGAPDWATLETYPHGLDEGETDRASWRLAHEDQRLHLAPVELEDAIRRVTAPADPAGLRLVTHTVWPGGLGWRHRADDAVEPGIGLHPDAGFEDGQTVSVKTEAGEVTGPVRLDPNQHAQAVIIPWGWRVPVGDVVPDDRLDPLSGAPEQAGLPCTVQPA
jgi:formate dehydrogenase